MQNGLSDWKKYERLMPDGDENAVDDAELARMNAYYSDTRDSVPKDASST